MQISMNVKNSLTYLLHYLSYSVRANLLERQPSFGLSQLDINTAFKGPMQTVKKCLEEQAAKSKEQA